MQISNLHRVILLTISSIAGLLVFNSILTNKSYIADLIPVEVQHQNKSQEIPQFVGYDMWSNETLQANITTSIFQTSSTTTFKTSTVTPEPRWELFDMGSPFHLDCQGLVAGNKTVLEEYLRNGRVVVEKEPVLPMDCESITRRISINSHFQNPTNIPYAVASNVYKDYLVVETILGMSYSARNSYCYAMDQKSNDTFKRNVRTLSKCFKNIQVLQEEFPFNSKGHFQDHAHFRCTQELFKKADWIYVLYTQNHDVPIRTNSEISEIIQLINGSQLHGNAEAHSNRYNVKNKTARDLKLFKNEKTRSATQLDTPIKVFKTPNQVFLSREFVKSLDVELNMTTILDAFNVQKYYGTDEMLFATLGLANHLGLPGQASPICLNARQVMRYVKWCFGKDSKCCLTHHRKHGVCINTVEYLPHILKHPGIISNKILPEIDYGTLLCISQELQKRSEASTISKNLRTYKDLFVVRERQLRSNGTFNPKTFKC